MSNGITGTMYIREQTPPMKLPKGTKLYMLMSVVCAPEGTFDTETLIPVRGVASQDLLDPGCPMLLLNTKQHMDRPPNLEALDADGVFLQHMWRV